MSGTTIIAQIFMSLRANSTQRFKVKVSSYLLDIPGTAGRLIHHYS